MEHNNIPILWYYGFKMLIETKQNKVDRDVQNE